MSVSFHPNYNSNKKLSFFESHNILHDKWMKTLTGNQWKVSCFTHRKTRGWQKFQDKISHSQFEEGTGLAKNTVIKVISELIEMGRMGKFKSGEIGKEECYYYLIFEEESINSNISYGLHNCTGTPHVTEHTIEEIKQIKEKIYKKEKEATEQSMYIHGCIPLTQSVYDDAVKTHTKAFIDHIVDRMDTYYSTHPDRAKKGGCYAYKLHLWIRNELKNKQRKKQSEELAFRQKEEEDRQFQIQQEALRAAKEKQRLEQEKAFTEKVEANRPIVEKYIEKYPGIVRISGMIWNGICEIVDKAHQTYTVFFTQDDFEAQIRSQLMKNGYLCT